MCLVVPLCGFAQGSLTPPGAPAPTMKTLQQVEPRTPISSAGFTITNSGSFYLATNLIAGGVGVTISADDVDLDLRGFAIIAGGSSLGPGIVVSASRENIWIGNGTVRGFGSYGVDASIAVNLRIEHVRVSHNSTYGIRAGDETAIIGCQAVSNNVGGLLIGASGTIKDSTVQGNGNLGIATGDDCNVLHCNASRNGTDGIHTGASTEVLNCISVTNGARGIFVQHGCLVSGCMVAGNSASGIYVFFPGCQIIGNTLNGNNSSLSAGDAGIYLDDSNNRVDGNHVTANGYAGIQVNASYVGNVVVRNTVSGNGSNNYINPGGVNDFGPIGNAATNTSPWANISH
jgi:hypothetical protein